MDNILKARAEKWFEEHRAEYIADLSAVIAIRSVSDTSSVPPYGQGCRDVLDKVLGMAESYGFKTINYDYKVGCAYAEGVSGKNIGIWGHLDVVPEGDNWNHKPYEPVLESDVLYGRGASDNKGPAVAMLYVLRCLKDLGVKLHHGVKVFFGCDEEKGMSDIIWYAANHEVPDFNMIPDSGFPVCYGEKGIIQADLLSNKKLSDSVISFGGGLVSNMVPDYAYIELRESPVLMSKLLSLSSPFEVVRAPGVVRINAYGSAMHAAHPYNGINAIYLLSRMLINTGIVSGDDADIFGFITNVNSDCVGNGLSIACEDELSGNLTCVGSILKQIDGSLQLSVNIRYPISVNGDDIVNLIAESCDSADFTMKLESDSKPCYFPKENPLVGALTDIFNSVAGKDMEAFTMSGGTYARKLKNAVAFGLEGAENEEELKKLPFIGGAHEHDEGVHIPSLIKGAIIYVLTLAEADKLL